MHDNLIGRVVADAGVDCAAAAMADSSASCLAAQPAAVDGGCGTH